MIRVAFLALLLLVPGLVLYRQLTRAGIRGSAIRLSRLQFPDIYAVKETFAQAGPETGTEIYLMSGNGTLNAFAASMFQCSANEDCFGTNQADTLTGTSGGDRIFGVGGTVLAKNQHYRQLHDLKLGRYDAEELS